MIDCKAKKEYTRKEIGGKAFGLFVLLRSGKKVPPFFVVPTGTDISSAEFAEELLAFADGLGCDLFAVRSSSVAEDSENSSFAGQYDTVLNVEKKDLLSAVRQVLASKNGARTATYASRLDLASTEMAVIVQKQLSPTKSGVAFSTSPFDGKQAVVESFSGQGEALVGGAITPERFCFFKDEASPQSIEGEVFAASQALERAYAQALDIEWAYDGELYFLQMRPLTVTPIALDGIDGVWQEYVYRNFAFFNQCVQVEATKKEAQERAFSFHIPVFEGLLVDGHEFYSERNDENVLRVWRTLDQEDFFERYIQKIYNSVRRTKNRAWRLQRAETERWSDAALLGAYRRALAAYLESYLPLMMRPDDYLHERLRKRLTQEDADTLLFAATYPVKSTYYAMEKYDFLNAAIAYNSGDSTSVDDYIEKYEWIDAPLGKSFTPLTRAEVVERISGLQEGVAVARLAALKKARKKSLALRRRALSEISELSTKRWVLLLAEFTFLRTYTTENSDRYFYYIKKKLLKEMARRIGVPTERLLYCSPKEVEEIFLGVRNIGVGERRRSGATFVFFENGYTMYEGNGLSLLKRLLPLPQGEKQLTGSVACGGCVRASVKVVTCARDMEKLHRGEILVTKMTTPELVRAMERAAGIITDEGGITCHAAIIAREYGVPCLVGTRNATVTLKDGMEVEVELDCIHGICKIIANG